MVSDAGSFQRDKTETDPSLRDLWTWFAALVRSGAASDAIVVGQELLARRPSDPRVLLGLASARCEAGEYSAAIELASRAVASGADQNAASLVRAEACLGSGDLEVALKQLGTCLSGDPDNPRAHELQVRCLYELERFPEAAAAAAVLVVLAPSSMQSHLLRSFAYEKTGDIHQAIDSQREVVRLGGDSRQVVRLGELLITAGDRREGTEKLAEAAESRPGDLALRERITLMVDHGGSHISGALKGLAVAISCMCGAGIVVIVVLGIRRVLRRRSYSPRVQSAVREWTHRRGHGISAQVWALLATALFLSVILPLLIYGFTKQSFGFIFIVPGLACALTAMYQYQRDLPKTFTRPVANQPVLECRCADSNVTGFAGESARSYATHLTFVAKYSTRRFQTMICPSTNVTWLARQGNVGVAYVVRLADASPDSPSDHNSNGAYL